MQGVLKEQQGGADGAAPKTALLQRYAAVRRFTGQLCTGLSPDDCQLQSMADASPVKWHLAHTTWFFETFVLAGALDGYRPFHPEYPRLLNSYYNGVGAQYPRPQRGLLSRPSLPEVLAYRAHVDTAMQRLLENDLQPDVAQRTELGLQHEQQHQELILTDLKHALSANPLRPAYRPGPLAPRAIAAPLRWIEQAGGLIWIGHDGNGFAYDNETPRHRVWLEAYSIASRAVTNGEYLDFIRDGGYRRPELWLSDGWAAAQAGGWTVPLYWSEDFGTIYTLRGVFDLDLQEPVCHVSYYEADAYARWAGARLPRESEWEAAAAAFPIEGNFVESGGLHPLSGARSPGFFGDVWEWTASAYSAYPGYRPLPGTLGEYNGKFMCNQFVLRGGSCASSASHLRASYRNFFAPQARWQFSGIRLARDRT